MNRNLDEAHRSKRTMQVVFPTAALARGLRFDQWRGSVLLLLSHWRVWIGAPGEEQAFHGDGTSENLGLGLQTRRGAGGGRISSESTAPVHEWCLACVSFRTPTTLVRLRFGALIPMTRLFTLILASALVSPASAQQTVSVTLGQFASYDEFGWSGNRRTTLAVPAGSEIIGVQISGGYLFANPPSQGDEAAIAIRMETATSSSYYAFINFPSGNYGGNFGPSTRTWTFTPGTYFCNDGNLEVEFYETYDDFNVTIDADWFSGSLIVTFRPPLAPTGACCIGEDCSLLTQSECAAVGGIWSGANTPCSSVSCTPPGQPVTFSGLSTTRVITYTATANSITPAQNTGGTNSYAHPDNSPMDAIIGNSASLGSASSSASASQVSSVFPFTLRGVGGGRASALGSGNGMGVGVARSTFQGSFLLGRSTPARIRWSLSAGGPSLTNSATVQLKRGTSLVWSRSASNSSSTGVGGLALQPGNYSVSVVGDASATAGLDGSAYGLYSEMAWTFKLSLPNTDCDADGLPDTAAIKADPTLDRNGDGLMDRCQCLADFNDDDQVDGADLSETLANWGQPGAGDANFDGIVNGDDLALILSSWGPCAP